jgi:hypothetical protein
MSHPGPGEIGTGGDPAGRLETGERSWRQVLESWRYLFSTSDRCRIVETGEGNRGDFCLVLLTGVGSWRQVSNRGARCEVIENRNGEPWRPYLGSRHPGVRDCLRLLHARSLR